MIQPKFIANQEALEQTVSSLQKVPAFAIDLEFDKNHFRYGFNMCLMQIFDGTDCYLIDPLSPRLDITAIYSVLENPTIQKIAFSFGEDMRLLHSMGCFPKNIFDIASAARIADYPPSSLGTVLETVLDINVNKSAQASDWHNRPLTPKQIEYAASDVLHLFDLKAALLPKIEQLGRTAWLIQENGIWDTVDYSDLDNNVFLREKDKKNLSEYEWFVFSQLMELREEKSKALNRPSYKVLSKDYLLEMAQRPNQIHRFEKIRNIHRSLKTPEFKEELKKTLHQAMKEASQKGLSINEKASKRLSPEEYQKFIQRKKQQDEAKKKIFKPIQNAMKEDLGENIITLLINNRIMEDWAIGRVDDLLPYKQELIQNYAQKLNLDVQQYLD